MQNKWSIFSVGVALLASRSLLSAEPSFRFSLDRNSVLAGDRATLEVRLEIPGLGEEDPIPEIQDDLLTQNEKFFVLQKDVTREQHTVIWRYAVTAYIPQNLTLPPLLIRFGPNTYSTESQPLSVISKRGQNDQELRESFGTLSLPIHWKKLFFYACAIGVFIALLPTFVRLFRKLRAQIWISKKHWVLRSTKPDHLAWFKRELSLLKQKITQGEEKEAYIDELTLLIKTYLSKVHDKPVFTMTSGEFEHVFSADPQLLKIHGLFRQCDSFKFAPLTELEPKPLALNGIQETERALCSP